MRVASDAPAPARSFARDLPFGRLVGVALPAASDAAALDALATALAPEEREHARDLPPARRATWIGGRAAAARGVR